MGDSFKLVFALLACGVFNYNSISTRGVPLPGPSRCAVFTSTDTSTFSHSVLASFIVRPKCGRHSETLPVFSLKAYFVSLLRPRGLPGSSVGKESACNAGHCLQCRKPRFDPQVGKSPWRRKWQPTPVFFVLIFWLTLMSLAFPIKDIFSSGISLTNTTWFCCWKIWWQIDSRSFACSALSLYRFCHFLFIFGILTLLYESICGFFFFYLKFYGSCNQRFFMFLCLF